MTEEERRYEILEVRKKSCEELIQKNKNMSITGCIIVRVVIDRHMDGQALVHIAAVL